MESSKISVAVNIPVLDDRQGLAGILDDLVAQLGPVGFTACIVDDGSTDGTVELVTEYMATCPHVHLIRRRKPGPGCRRGGATRAGLIWLLDHTEHTFFVDLDADGSQPVSEVLPAIDRLLEAGADVAVASRYLHGSVVTGRPLFRRAGSRGYNLVLRTLIGRDIHDYSHSFRFYRRSAAAALLDLAPAYDSPVHLVEMMAHWRANGFRIIEIPTTYIERAEGDSKVTVGNYVDGLSGALRVGIAYRAGRFRG